MRILHTADWQLGRRFRQFPEDEAVVLAQARFQAVSRIHGIAEEIAAELTVVAGDVFDSHTLSDQELRRGMQLIAESPCPIVLLPGNHDADSPGGVWDRALRLHPCPSHVHVLRASQATQALMLFDQRLAIVAVPLAQRHAAPELGHVLRAQLAAQALRPECIKLGIAHGGVLGQLPESVPISNPIPRDLAETLGLDYLALGDWHGHLSIDARTAYAGTPEPDRFRNNASGKVLQVDLAPGQIPVVQSRHIAQFDWQTHSIVVHTSDSADSVMAELNQRMGYADVATTPSALRNLVLQLTLQGRIDYATQQALLLDLANLQAKVHLLDLETDALALQPTRVDLAQLQHAGYAETVAERLLLMLNESDQRTRAQANEALAILLSLGATA